MRRAFRQVDKNGTGVIAPVEFRCILKEFQINLSENEFFHVLTFYDADMTGKIHYNDFIRAFISA
jgi:Ca2+-binding EF-hand superfamily protein